MFLSEILAQSEKNLIQGFLALIKAIQTYAFSIGNDIGLQKNVYVSHLGLPPVSYNPTVCKTRPETVKSIYYRELRAIPYIPVLVYIVHKKVISSI